jgi:hypothetical protein
MVPERVRAMRTPSMRPETTIDRAVARLFGGARSPTRGSMSWGVTVVMETRKDIAVKTGREVVKQRMSLFYVSPS